MEQRRKHHGSGGFMLGVIVGVVITLLFTTKRGRELVKDLTEKGLDTFSQLEKRMQQTEEEFDDFDEDDVAGDDYVKPEQRLLAEETTKEPVKEAKPVDKPKEEVKKVEKKDDVTSESNSEAKVAKSTSEEEKPKKSSVRRFFRLKK